MRAYRAPTCSAKQAMEVVLGGFERLCVPNEFERALIQGLDGNITAMPVGEFQGNGHVGEPVILVSGWACRCRNLSDGRRQIISFLLPGDLVCLTSAAAPLGLCRATALSPMQMCNLAPLLPALRGGDDRCPNLAAAIAVAEAMEQAYLIEHVARIGRRTAYERMCNLFLELYHRLSQVGLAEGDRFAMPLTQETLADATSLSIVHVNRTLQQLRRERLLQISKGEVTLLNRATLEMIADFQAPEPNDWRKITAAQARWDTFAHG